MSRPKRDRKPSAALRFIQASEEQWEQHERDLADHAPERRRARLERQRAKKRAEREAEREKERAQKARQRERQRQKKERTGSRKKSKRKGDAPKRPTSAYFFFTRQNRDLVREHNPHASFGDISRILGDQWRSLSADERGYYEDLAADEKERFERERARAGRGGGSAAAAAPSSPKVSKPKAKKKSRTRAPAKAPTTYFEFCAEAIGALRDRKGSSMIALEKFVTANHPELDFKKHHFKAALKRGVENGSFIKVRASYKLADSMKKRWYR